MLNVCVLSTLSNEINSVKKAVSYRKSYVFLERMLVWSKEVFWIWYGTLQEKKNHPCFDMAVKSAEIWYYLPLSLLVGMWYTLWQDKALESIVIDKADFVVCLIIVM